MTAPARRAALLLLLLVVMLVRIAIAAWDHRSPTPFDNRDRSVAVSGWCLSPDRHWLVLGLDPETNDSNPALYLCDLSTAESYELGRGKLAPEAWDEDGGLHIVADGAQPGESRRIDPHEVERSTRPRSVVLCSPDATSALMVNHLSEWAGDRNDPRTLAIRSGDSWVRWATWDRERGGSPLLFADDCQPSLLDLQSGVVIPQSMSGKPGRL